MNGSGSSHPPQKPAGAQARRWATPSPHILLVDDDPTLRQLGASLLARSGYQVDTAEDGETGWEALQSKDYDLLITDNNMPKVSGVELVKKLRSEGVALPVILVSGTMLMEELNGDPWLPLDAMLLKPFTGDELLGAVEKVLSMTGRPREHNEPLPDWRSQPSADALRL